MTPTPVIAMWEVSGETFQDMLDEANSDAIIFFNGHPTPEQYQIEVINCEPYEWEESRIVKWKGKAIIS